MAKSIFRNYLFNVAYQVATLFLPLVTTPYISRVLLPEGIGTAAFIGSITNYFILAATLGINLYGNREVAYCREDRIKLSKTFWSIYTLQLICSVFSIIAYVLFVIFFVDENIRFLYFISGINLLGTMFDITWYFYGQEEFQKTVTRNLIVRLIGVVLIFTLVKDINDLWLYILISSFTSFFGQAIMWIFIPKEVKSIKLKKSDIFRHFLPTIKLLIPQIAIQIYTVMDKTMIGVIANTSEVAYYENAQKIIKMALGVATALGTVLMPRISNYFANDDYENIRKYIYKSFVYISFLTFPLSFGIMGLAPEFVTWFFGNAFIPVVSNMIIISPIMIAIGWSNILGIQLMLPVGKEKEFTISVTLGAIVNFLLNIVLINKFNSLGAAMSSVIAEFLVTIVMFNYMKKYVDLRSLLKIMSKYLVGSLIMFSVVRIIGYFMGSSILTTILQIICGIIVYAIYSILTHSEVVFYFINRFLRKNMRDL